MSNRCKDCKERHDCGLSVACDGYLQEIAVLAGATPNMLTVETMARMDAMLERLRPFMEAAFAITPFEDGNDPVLEALRVLMCTLSTTPMAEGSSEEWPAPGKLDEERFKALLQWSGQEALEFRKALRSMFGFGVAAGLRAVVGGLIVSVERKPGQADKPAGRDC